MRVWTFQVEQTPPINIYLVYTVYTKYIKKKFALDFYRVREGESGGEVDCSHEIWIRSCVCRVRLNKWIEWCKIVHLPCLKISLDGALPHTHFPKVSKLNCYVGLFLNFIRTREKNIGLKKGKTITLADFHIRRLIGSKKTFIYKVSITRQKILIIFNQKQVKQIFNHIYWINVRHSMERRQQQQQIEYFWMRKKGM